jgi:hypothetical protein
MGAQTARVQTSREDAGVQRKEQFQEVPGEAEAEAVRSAFLQGAAQQPEQLGAALSGLDGATRARAIGRLQRLGGNAFVQRVAAQGSAGRLVGLSQGDMVSEVQRRKGSGSALPDDTRSQMEGYFGADLSGVRVHADGEAASLSRELNAQAFTTGSDIFFGEGRYNPSSSEGMGTLAHELTHVRQQGGMGAPVQRANEDALQALKLQRDTIQREDEGGESEDEEALQAMALQRQAIQREDEGGESEDEELQMMALQRQAVQREDEGGESEDEELQMMAIQRMALQREDEGGESEDEEALQMMALQRAAVQRDADGDDA